MDDRIKKVQKNQVKLNIKSKLMEKMLNDEIFKNNTPKKGDITEHKLLLEEEVRAIRIKLGIIKDKINKDEIK